MKRFSHYCLLLLAVFMLGACNSEDADMASESEKSTVYVSLTDADGDFLVYNVAVTSLSLTRNDGVEVELLPQSSELDFVQYVELSELFTAAQIPSGIYTSGTITLDYTGADVQVENGGVAEPAVVVDENGVPVMTLELEVKLSNSNHLLVKPGIPALLELDFDLEASHVIDLGTTPVTATITPILYANAQFEDGKTQRLRGPLDLVNVQESAYTINLRPFHRRTGDFGSIRIHTSNTTQFEIDGVVYTGAEGLTALANKGPGTATIALAELDVSERQFNASIVYAGSSVPGGELDGAKGVITARTGDTLTLHGALLIRTDGSVSYSDVLTVTLGPDTQVTRPVSGEGNLGKDAISVGQQVTVLGTANGLQLDASNGWVRMGFTHVNATVLTVNGTELLLDVDNINRRRVSLFDFSGTGITPADDADPANYQVNITGLTLNSIAGGEPVRVSGFMNAFGLAPPDFAAWSVANFESARAVLDITWDNSTAAFVSLDTSGIVPNLNDPLLGTRHHLRRGGISTDIAASGSTLTITSNASDFGLYVIRTPEALTVYADFDSFIAALTVELDGSVGVNRLHAAGDYDAASDMLDAHRLVVILE